MKILQVAPSDAAGGGERIARMLFEAYRQRGHDSWLAVGQKRSDDPDILPMLAPGDWQKAVNRAADALAPVSYRLQRTIRGFARPNVRRWISRLQGHELFEYPETGRLLSLLPQPPNILHLHNLHGNYFDLRLLPDFSYQFPTVLTLHDAWLLSGHCAHSLDCERWLTGCGHCPDLTLYPALSRDGTAYNWQRKQSIYRRSRLHIVTPSQWLMDKVQRSMLLPGIISAEVIPNGINLDLFKPGEKAAVRAALDLPQDALILLFAGAGVRSNPWKDYATLRAAVSQVAERTSQPVIFVGVGENAPPEKIGSAEIRFVPFVSDVWRMVQYYQAADIYIHAARADTFPNVILEALACGLPVVATAVGGIPEQVTPLDKDSANATGFLTPPGDSVNLAEAILRLMNDADLRRTFSANARRDAEHRFDESRMVDRYLALYEKISSE